MWTDIIDIESLSISSFVNGIYREQWVKTNRSVSQMRVPLAACHELVLDYNTLPKLLYGFEH